MLDRTTVKRGPAVITYDGSTFHSKSDVVVDLLKTTFDVETSTIATRDKRVDSQMWKLTWTPDGRVTSGILGSLYACSSYILGQSVFGAADKAVVVHWKDGTTMTFPSGGITKPPDLEFSASKTLFSGNAEMTLIGKNNTAWSDAAKFFTLATSAYTETANVGSIVTETPTVSWGEDAPWSGIKTDGGVKVAFDMQTAQDIEDGAGVFDLFFQGLQVTASFVPKNVSLAELMAAAKLQGSGARRGASLSSASLGDLVVTNSGVWLSITSAALMKFPVQAGRAVTNRIGEVQLVNTITDGASGDSVFSIALTAP